MTRLRSLADDALLICGLGMLAAWYGALWLGTYMVQAEEHWRAAP